MFTVPQLKQLCSKYRLTPSKNYGQNFLINPAPIQKMLATAELSKNDTVIEVGPGFGALTFALAQRAGKVIAFEIEKKLQPYWDEQLKKYKNIEVGWGNALKAPLPNQKYRVIANLPYQITSNVLRKFLEAAVPPELMVLMVQKEVAERICAKPGDMSLLAVSVQYFADSKIIMNVPRGYFWPEPKVDSAVIKLKMRALARNDNDEWFFRVVKAGFAQKRKLLVKNLQPLIDKTAPQPPSGDYGASKQTARHYGASKQKLEKIFAKMGLSPNARAQELSLEQWNQLSTLLLG